MSHFQTWPFKALVSCSSLTDQKMTVCHTNRCERLLVFFLDWLHFKWHCKGATRWQTTATTNRRGKQNEEIQTGIVGWRLCSCCSDPVLIRHCSWLATGGWARRLGCESWRDTGHSHVAISILLWLLRQGHKGEGAVICPRWGVPWSCLRGLAVSGLLGPCPFSPWFSSLPVVSVTYPFSVQQIPFLYKLARAMLITKTPD